MPELIRTLAPHAFAPAQPIRSPGCRHLDIPDPRQRTIDHVVGANFVPLEVSWPVLQGRFRRKLHGVAVLTLQRPPGDRRAAAAGVHHDDLVCRREVVAREAINAARLTSDTSPILRVWSSSNDV
jgi:hypothetical protein